MKNIKSKDIISAISILDEKHVDRVAAQRNASKLNSSSKKTRIKLPSMQVTGIAAAVLLLVVGTVAMFRVFAPDTSVIPPETDIPAASQTQPPKSGTPAAGWTWIVEPILDYGTFGYCPLCDSFTTQDDDYVATADRKFKVLKINEITGDVTENECCETDYAQPRENPADVFEGEINGDFVPAWITRGGAAVRPTVTVTVVVKDYIKNGILHKSGGLLVDFDDGFDKIWLICENTAFVVTDVTGDTMWGIIGFNGYVPDESQTAPPVATEEPLQPPDAPTIEGIAWFVEPIFTHYTWFCYTCDAFSGARSYGDDGIIDERTALPTGNEHGAHGGEGKVWIYDPVLNLFGYRSNAYAGYDMALYPVNEFAQRFPEQANQLLNVLEVDSTMQEAADWEVGWEDNAPRPATTLPQAAYSGKVAAIFNGQLVSDFEFEAIEHNGWYYNSQRGRIGTVAAVNRGGRFGVLDRRGDIIVPFELDEILVIDEYTAFAKVGDFWGIITWVDIEDVPHRESTGGNPPYVLPPCTLENGVN
jgi:hypothetical protein